MILFILKKIGQSGGVSRWRVCYQRGLPRLVLKIFGKRVTQSVNELMTKVFVEQPPGYTGSVKNLMVSLLVLILDLLRASYYLSEFGQSFNSVKSLNSLISYCY